MAAPAAVPAVAGQVLGLTQLKQSSQAPALVLLLLQMRVLLSLLIKLQMLA
jgi:hypothetical protein